LEGHILVHIVQKSTQEDDIFVEVEDPRRFGGYIAPSSLIVTFWTLFWWEEGE
jgi:hypothetical protein